MVRRGAFRLCGFRLFNRYFGLVDDPYGRMFDDEARCSLRCSEQQQSRYGCIGRIVDQFERRIADPSCRALRYAPPSSSRD